MVNPAELVDLDPTLEDILSMWGKDITAQNVEHYFGVFELSRLEELSHNETPLFLLLDKEAGSVAHNTCIAAVSKQVGREIVSRGADEEGLPIDPKGKAVSPRFLLSKGFEDLSNLGLSAGYSLSRAPGDLPSISRVSLPRESLSLKGPTANDSGELLVGERAGSDGLAKGCLSSGNFEAGFASQNPSQPEIETIGGISQSNTERNDG